MDDFMLASEDCLTTDEKYDLKNIVSCDRVCTKEEYEKILKEKGFKNIQITDMTETFMQFTNDRVQVWDANIEENKKIYGEDCANGWTSFVHTMVKLFKGGNLRGCNITATM